MNYTNDSIYYRNTKPIRMSAWNRNCLMVILAAVILLAAIGSKSPDEEKLGPSLAETDAIIADMNRDPALTLALRIAFIRESYGYTKYADSLVSAAREAK